MCKCKYKIKFIVPYHFSVRNRLENNSKTTSVFRALSKSTSVSFEPALIISALIGWGLDNAFKIIFAPPCSLFCLHF